jgi:hypothetical protein
MQYDTDSTVLGHIPGHSNGPITIEYEVPNSAIEKTALATVVGVMDRDTGDQNTDINVGVCEAPFNMNIR